MHSRPSNWSAVTKTCCRCPAPPALPAEQSTVDATKTRPPRDNGGGRLYNVSRWPGFSSVDYTLFCRQGGRSRATATRLGHGAPIRRSGVHGTLNSWPFIAIVKLPVPFDLT